MMLSIEQIASPIRRHRRQRANLIGLGLNRIGKVVERADTPETRGMIKKVRHLVRVIGLTEARVASDTRKCIYCGLDRALEEFSDEHILSRPLSQTDFAATLNSGIASGWRI